MNVLASQGSDAEIRHSNFNFNPSSSNNHWNSPSVGCGSKPPNPWIVLLNPMDAVWPAVKLFFRDLLQVKQARRWLQGAPLKTCTLGASKCEDCFCSAENQFISCGSLASLGASLDTLKTSPAFEVESQRTVFERMRYYAVIEGHGGVSCAKYIESSMARIIIEKMELHNDFKNIPAVLCDVVEMALLSLDEEYLKIAKENGDTSGASVVIALHLDDWLCVSNIGDTSAVLFDDQGQVIRMSSPHSARSRKEYMRIFTAGGNISKDGFFQRQPDLKRSRAVGSLELKLKYPGIMISKPETALLKLKPALLNLTPTLVLSSGCLWCGGQKMYNLSKQVIHSWSNYAECNYMSAQNQKPASSLKDCAKLAGCTEDMCVLCVQIHPLSPSA